MQDTLLRFFILLLVFASVLIGAEVLVRNFRASRTAGNAINERLRLIGRGLDREQVMTKLLRPTYAGVSLPGPFGAFAQKLESNLAGAGLKISSSRLLLYLVAATCFLFMLVTLVAMAGGTVMSGGKLFMIATFAVGAGFGLPMMVFSRMADNRRKKLTQQFPVALDVFVRGLRAGHPIGSALELLTEEMQDPIGSEFGIVVDEMTYGADLRDALQNMADRCGVEDMHMFVVSLAVQSETGGNLAEILENLSKVIRERAAMVMKVRALSSEGRMTAVMLTGLPILTFVGLFLLNPAFYLEVADDPAFVPGFAGLIILYVIGFIWIRRMVDLKV